MINDIIDDGLTAIDRVRSADLYRFRLHRNNKIESTVSRGGAKSARPLNSQQSVGAVPRVPALLT